MSVFDEIIEQHNQTLIQILSVRYTEMIMPNRSNLRGAARKSALKRDALDFLREIARRQALHGLR